MFRQMYLDNGFPYVCLLCSGFAVHPVSMNNTNHLVNSDNMGYASLLFEQEKNKGMLPGEVGAFSDD